MARTVKKPEERRRDIVATARDLFMEKDYEQTTMHDVMKHLDIAKGTIYHYFRSKEELLEAVVQEYLEDYLSHVRASFKGQNRPALEQLKTLIAACNLNSRESHDLNGLHRPGNIGLHTRLLAVTTKGLAPLFAEVIELGREEGIFEVDHPLSCAEFLIGGLQFLCDVGCYPWQHEDLVRRQEAIPSLIETLLKAPKGSFDFLKNKKGKT